MGKNKAKDQRKQAKLVRPAKSPLPRAFAKATSNSASARRVSQKSPPAKAAKPCITGPEDLSKKETSGFLMYLRSASQQKDPSIQSAAKAVLDSYRQMGSDEKKVAITNFFKSGGRRAGLNSLFQQIVTHSQNDSVGEWKGYITPTKLMKLWEVLGCL